MNNIQGKSFDCYSIVICLSFNGHSMVIQLSFNGHSIVIQLFNCYRMTINDARSANDYRMTASGQMTLNDARSANDH
jgi:hypothetical protein